MGSQPGKPFGPGQLYLSCRPVAEGEDNEVMMKWGKLGAVQQISWHLPYGWGKPRKTSVRKPLEALSTVASHCFKWGPFPPNEVCRIMLPAPLAKSIRSSEKSVFKNFISGIRRSQDLGSAKCSTLKAPQLLPVESQQRNSDRPPERHLIADDRDKWITNTTTPQYAPLIGANEHSL